MNEMLLTKQQMITALTEAWKSGRLIVQQKGAFWGNVYHDDGNICCAIGAALPRGLVPHGLRGETIDLLVKATIVSFPDKETYEFARTLQVLHDGTNLIRQDPEDFRVGVLHQLGIRLPERWHRK